MLVLDRENFKRLAAGNYVMGKSSFDPKMLEAYVDGALLLWDMQTKAKAALKANQEETKETKLLDTKTEAQQDLI